MRMLVTVVVLVAVALFSAPKTLAQEMCPGLGMTPTITSLSDCVEHALTMGHIDRAGVANSLLAKLDTAQAAQDRKQVAVSIHLLEGFINEASAQAGIHIEEMHAAHMIMHAEMVIAALGG